MGAVAADMPLNIEVLNIWRGQVEVQDARLKIETGHFLGTNLS